MITATNLTTTSSTDVFLADGEVGITTLMICNHSASTDAIVNVWAVPSVIGTGAVGVVSNASLILKNLTIVAADTFVMDMEKLVLENNAKIVAQASVGDTLNVVISSMAVA